MRASILAVLIGLAGHAAAAEPPRDVTLVLVVDQLPDARVDRLLSRLSPWLGARSTSRYAHATTVTCVGHVTLATGLSPRDHGIVSNRWYPGGEGEAPADCLSGGGTDIAAGAPTVAEVARTADVWTAAVSLKRRSAIPLGGGADFAVWYELSDGHFVGGDKLAGGAAARAAADAAVATASRWTSPEGALPDDLRAGEGVSRYGTSRCAAGNDDVASCHGDAVFPYVVDGRDQDPADVLWDPRASEALVAAADAILDTAEGRRGLLGVSFSEIDVVGHAWTSDSREYAVALDHLGDVLAAWFTRLDARGIRWRAVLTADHGGLGTPRVLAPATGADAGASEDPATWLTERVAWRDTQRAAATDPVSQALFEVVDRVDAGWVANRVLVDHGVTDGLARVSEPLLWLPPLDPALREVVVAEIAAALMAARAPVRGGEPLAPYAAVFDVRGAPKVIAGEVSDEVAAAVAEAVPPGVADLYVLLAPEAVVVELGRNPLGLGTDHGTPWPYDRDVPLLLLGGRVGRAWPAVVDARQVAPTVAALVGADVSRALDAARGRGVNARPGLRTRPR